MSKWNVIKCVICGSESKEHKHLFSKSHKENNYTIVRCVRCGLVFVNPQPPEDLLKDFYDKELYSEEWLSQFPDRNNASYFENRPESAVEGYKVYRDSILEYKPGGKILDIGCGDGVLLRLFNNKWELFGLDISEKSKDFLKGNKYRINFHYGTLFDAKFPDEFFDVVVSIDTIEHVTNPLEVFREINRVSKKYGIICIHTINIKGRIARIQKENWVHISPPGHLYYFSPKTLKLLLEKAEFKVLKFDMRIPLFAPMDYGSLVKGSDSKGESDKQVIERSNKIKNFVFKSLRPFKPVLIPVYDSLCQLKGRIIGKHDITVYARKVG